MIGSESGGHESVNKWTATSGWSEMRHAGLGFNRVLGGLNSCEIKFKIFNRSNIVQISHCEVLKQ